MDMTQQSGCAAIDAAEAAGEESAAAEPAPFLLVTPLKRTTPLIFASPHSGRRYPPELLNAARAGLAHLRRSEDPYVDELVSGVTGHGAALIAATVARAFVDLNRHPAELDPDMYAEPLEPEAAHASPRVQAGLGAIPRVTGDGLPIYHGKLARAEAARRIGRVHAPYHTALAALIEDTRAELGCAVLIDCHSMPSCARGAYQPDIVLGDRFGAACHPSVMSLVEATLKRRGYRVARNAPFAGGYTTQTYGRPHRRVHALQVEVNRALYLDEATLVRNAGFDRLRADFARLAEALAAAALHRSLA
jgi:N-formylglutamate amidohydrolase